MPNTKDIKRRIKSVKSIKQITSAMQLVAVSKMRRAEKRSKDADTFAYGALEILERLTYAMKGEPEHPYWAENNSRKIGIVLITTNRGFCGGLNVNLMSRCAEELKKIQKQGLEAEIISIGRKGQSFARRFGLKIAADFSGFDDRFTVSDISPTAKIISSDYLNQNYCRVYLVFSQFINTLVQRPVVRQMLPLTIEKFKEIAESNNNRKENSSSNEKVYIFEPGAETVFETLVPYLLEVEIYKALLEAKASEHAARMVAMKNATDKAGELIEDLTLAYNQARQAGITREIAEIAAGASAV